MNKLYKAIADFQQEFSYDSESGKITRKNKKNADGSLDSYGYLILKLKGRQYKAHRIAWALHYGKFPKNNIDHINGNPLDNRILNLRDVPQKINIYNSKRKRNKDTGEIGICVDKATKGLKKKYCVGHEGKLYRFYGIDEAKAFRETLPIYEYQK